MLSTLEDIEKMNGKIPVEAPVYIATIKRALAEVGLVFECERKQEQGFFKALDRNFLNYQNKFIIF